MNIQEKLGDIYIEALTEVIATVSGISLNIGSRQTDSSFDDITGVMYLHGKKSGMLFVTAKKPDVKVLCSKMTGVSAADVTDDEIDDTMCELVNMTAGSAKLRLSNSDYMFSLSQPFVIKGNDVSIVTKSVTNVESGTLTGSDISVRLKVIY